MPQPKAFIVDRVRSVAWHSASLQAMPPLASRPRTSVHKAACLLLLLLLLPTLSGCLVTEGRYLQKVSEADGLAQEQLTLKRSHGLLATENSSLKLSLDRMGAELATALQEKGRCAEVVARHADERKDIEKDLKASPVEALQRIAELRQQIAELEAREQKQKAEISATELSAKKLQQRDEDLVRSTSALYEQLLDVMSSDISLGKVRLSELQGRLSLVIPATVLFVAGEVDLKGEGVSLLSRVAAALKSVKGKQIRVEGHTDNLPARLAFTAGYPANWELSAVRAVNVVRQLQLQGVPPQSLAAAAYSEYRPITSNESSEGRGKNGRIEIHLEPANL